MSNGIDMSNAKVAVPFDLNAPEVQGAILIAASNIVASRQTISNQGESAAKEVVSVANAIRDILIKEERSLGVAS